MSVIRINKTNNYTVMSNHHFRNKEMSLKAKGLLSLMLSLPETWDYSINGLVAICKENQTSINSTLKELKQFGYLNVTKLLPNETETGRIEYIYDIYEIPKIEKQEDKKQGVENLGVEFQGVENQVQLNTNNKNTNNKITKKKERKKTTYDVIIHDLVNDEEIKECIYDFIKMRNLIKKPMTDRALKNMINKLYKLSSNKDEQIEILSNSINKSWSDIYELKTKKESYTVPTKSKMPNYNYEGDDTL